MLTSLNGMRPVWRAVLAAAILIGFMALSELLWAWTETDLLSGSVRAVGVIAAAWLAWPILPTRLQDAFAGRTVSVARHRWHVLIGLTVAFSALLLISRSVRYDIGGTLIMLIILTALVSLRLSEDRAAERATDAT